MSVTLKEATKRGGLITISDFVNRVPTSYGRYRDLLEDGDIDYVAIPLNSRGRGHREKIFILADQVNKVRKIKRWKRGGKVA